MCLSEASRRGRRRRPGPLLGCGGPRTAIRARARQGRIDDVDGRGARGAHRGAGRWRGRTRSAAALDNDCGLGVARNAEPAAVKIAAPSDRRTLSRLLHLDEPTSGSSPPSSARRKPSCFSESPEDVPMSPRTARSRPRRGGNSSGEPVSRGKPSCRPPRHRRPRPTARWRGVAA